MSTIRDEFEALLPEPVILLWQDHPNGAIPVRGYSASQMRKMFDAATERAAKLCEDRATAYRTTRAPGWHEVDHECTQCAAAIRAKGGEANADQT